MSGNKAPPHFCPHLCQILTDFYPRDAMLARVLAIILCLSDPAWGRGTPFRRCCSLVHSLLHLLLFITSSLFPFLIHFTYFPLLSIQSLSTRIVPLRFQARGRRRRPNLGLVCFVLLLCYLYSLVKIYSGVLLYLV